MRKNQILGRPRENPKLMPTSILDLTSPVEVVTDATSKA
jgi:hypothetical protein